jgi:hypothetical protein
MTVVLAIVSDMHAGSTVAVCPPKIVLDDGGEYVASKAQQWLWQNWLAYWARVDAVRKTQKAKLYTVFNGDATEGSHHGTTQILSGNPTAQAAVLNALMEVPLALHPDQIAIVRGTEAHVGASACYEERIAIGLKKDKRPVILDAHTGNGSHWHLRLEVEGVRLDFAHHGRVGSRPWTKPNVTANLAAEIFYSHARSGIPHPHLAIRSHMHQLVDTHDQHPTRVIQTPAWQLATAYIHRIAPGALSDIGGLIVTIDKGVMDIEKVMFAPDPSPLWKDYEHYHR